MITRRLDAEERKAIISGCVYVWEERTADSDATGMGIERWCVVKLPIQPESELILSSSTQDRLVSLGPKYVFSPPTCSYTD